jgi:hypothetical protein
MLNTYRMLSRLRRVERRKSCIGSCRLSRTKSLPMRRKGRSCLRSDNGRRRKRRRIDRGRSRSRRGWWAIGYKPEIDRRRRMEGHGRDWWAIGYKPEIDRRRRRMKGRGRDWWAIRYKPEIDRRRRMMEGGGRDWWAIRYKPEINRRKSSICKLCRRRGRICHRTDNGRTCKGKGRSECMRAVWMMLRGYGRQSSA